MTTQELIALQESSLRRQMDWITAANSRVAAVTTIDLAMLGALAAMAPKSMSLWSTSAAVFATLAAIPLIASVALSYAAMFPRLDGPKGSAVYFGGIVARSSEQYRGVVRSMSPDEYLDDLIDQTHRNAQIAAAKFRNVAHAMQAFFVAILFWLVAVYVLYGASTLSR